MQVIIGGQHVEIKDTLREYIRRKLTRIDRHFGPVIRSHVVLSSARNHHRVKAAVHTKGPQWHAAAEDKEPRLAFDRVVDKLNCQAIKHKGGIVGHHQEDGGLKNRPDI